MLTRQNGQPRQENSPGRGCRLSPRRLKTCHLGIQHSAKGPVSRILSCAVIPLDAALPRAFISDLPGGFGNNSSRLGASGRCAAPHDSLRRFPPYLVLLRVGFTLPPISLPGRCALTAPFHPYPGAEDCPSRRTFPASPGVPAAAKLRGSRGGIFSVALAVHGF